MKRAILTGALVGAFAIVASASIAVATPAPGAFGGGNALAGNGNVWVVGLNAQPGDPATGSANVEVYTPGGVLLQHFNGAVTEYHKTGNAAWFCGEIRVLEDNRVPPAGSPTFFRVVVEDNGQPGSGTPDRVFFERNTTEVCNLWLGTGTATLTDGNLIVRGDDVP
jgi:hypothetical protein